MSVLQPSTGLYLEQWARAAGFVSVSHKMWKCPGEIQIRKTCDTGKTQLTAFQLVHGQRTGYCEISDSLERGSVTWS